MHFQGFKREFKLTMVNEPAVFRSTEVTLKHLIFTASKFCDFKRLIYWRSLIWRTTLKGKNKLPLGSISFFNSSPF